MHAALGDDDDEDHLALCFVYVSVWRWQGNGDVMHAPFSTFNSRVQRGRWQLFSFLASPQKREQAAAGKEIVKWIARAFGVFCCAPGKVV